MTKDILKKFLCTTILLQGSLYANSKTETAGDILTLLIPAVAYGTTLYTQDNMGQMEFYKAYGGTIFLTHFLKETVRASRPNRPDNHTSFPSGHTSSAFSGASFIHKKYGFKYAIPSYIGAIYTGYSRVHAEKHYTRDVVAGAILGIGFSWYFVTPYKNLNITPTVDSKKYGVQFNYKW